MEISNLYKGGSIPKYTENKMSVTTIKINKETKSQLDLFREYKNESYDEVIKKVVYIAKTSKKKPKLSKELVIEIEKARMRLKKGNFLTEDEAKLRLGL